MKSKKLQAFSKSSLVHAALILGVGLLLLNNHTKVIQPIELVSLDDLPAHLASEHEQAIHRTIEKSKSLRHEETVPDRPALDAPTTSSTTTVSESSGQNPPSSAQAASELQIYLAQIVKRIHETKQYPKASLFNEEEGIVEVELVVSLQGVIEDVQVIRSSSFAGLDQAALDAVKAMGKLAPLPSSFKDAAHFHIPIHFRIKH